MATLIQCPLCGGKLASDAPTCIHCGHRMHPVPVVEEPRQWETCRIEWSPRVFLGKTMPPHTFWEDAVHPFEGSYSAGASAKFNPGGLRGLFDSEAPPNGMDKNAVAAFEELRNQLIREGWEETGRVGNAWWMHGFRRPVETRFDIKVPVPLYASIDRSAVLRELPAGTAITILQARDDWAKVRSDTGETGYVFPDPE